ncbi:small ubiquitin-related modifier sumo protein [Rutstroemia sp. NJR-2017a BBW]|nr:small ubiquitin-related modifier sumo protein [Rutstroemia sp. NJR-2017a BBW]
MGDVIDGASALPEPAKKKGFSIFKKKAVAPQAPVAEPVDHIDAFSRGKQLFAARLREEELERAKKAEKRERKRTSQSREKSESSPRPEKKFRKDVQPDNVELYSSDSNSSDEVKQQHDRKTSTISTPKSRKSPAKPLRDTQRSPTSLIGRYNKDVHEKAKDTTLQEPEQKGYISVSDTESDSDHNTTSPVKQRARRRSSSLPIPIPASVTSTIVAPDDEEEHFSDEEFPELLAKARERKRLAELEKERAAAAFANKNHEPGRSVGDDVFQLGPAAPADPVVNIFITSRLQDSKPLMIKRKLSGRLREVRLAWCARQSVDGEPWPEDVKDSIFLSWKGKKLFDVTTCSSLGIKVGPEGDLHGTGEGFTDDGGIHMEAWTQGLWDDCLALAEIEGEASEVEEVEEVETEPVRIKLTLKANVKDLKDYKIAVKPTTTIQKLTDLYRNQKNIPADKRVILDFDGEHLDPEMTVVEAELSDMDTIDVYIR